MLRNGSAIDSKGEANNQVFLLARFVMNQYVVYIFQALFYTLLDLFCNQMPLFQCLYPQGQIQFDKFITAGITRPKLIDRYHSGIGSGDLTNSIKGRRG